MNSPIGRRSGENLLIKIAHGLRGCSLFVTSIALLKYSYRVMSKTGRAGFLKDEVINDRLSMS